MSVTGGGRGGQEDKEWGREHGWWRESMGGGEGRERAWVVGRAGREYG